MKLKPTTALITAAVIVIAGVSLSVAMGWWTTQSTKVPVKLEAEGLQEKYDPADIRGSYTFGEISKLFGVPLQDLAQAYGVKAEEAEAFQTKKLETIFGEGKMEVGTSSVRMFVAWYTGLPYTQTETENLPAAAVEVLVKAGKLTPQQTAYLAGHTAPMPEK